MRGDDTGADGHQGNGYPMGSVIYDGEVGCYGAWYRRYPESGGPLGLYAKSKRGLDWRKPDLGLFEWNGSTANNTVGERGWKRTPELPAVFKDPGASEPANRYEIWHPLGGKVPLRFYPDHADLHTVSFA